MRSRGRLRSAKKFRKTKFARSSTTSDLPYSGINLSYSNSAPIGPGDADILVALTKDHRPTAEYEHDLRLKLNQEFPGVTFYFLPADIVSQILNFGLPAPIDVQVVGQNLDGNRAFADQLLNKLKYVPGIVDLRIQQTFDQPKLHIEVDRTKAQQIGFSARDVAQNVLISLSGSFQTTPNYWLDSKTGVSYSIAAQTPQYRVDSLQDLENIPVTGAGTRQNAIMASVATFSRGSEMAVVSHYNIKPVIDIFGAVQGRDLGGVAREIQPIIDNSKKDLPRGSQLIVRGQILTMNSSFSGLLWGLAFSIVLVYLLIVVNFQSWLDPFHHLDGFTRCAGRHRLVLVYYPHHRQRSGVDRRHHVHGRGYREQHPGRQLLERAAGRGQDRYRSGPGIRFHAFPPGVDDRSGHDHRHVADGHRPR